MIAGCGGSGSDAADANRFPDSGGPIWTLPLHDLDQALLSAWVGGEDEVVLVGGVPERGLAIELDRAGTPAPEDDRWRELTLPEGTPLLWWVWGEPGGATFLVGEGATILRRDDDVWVRQDVDAEVPAGTTFYGVWGTGADDVWAVGGSLAGVGDPGVIVHWDGLTWSRDPDEGGQRAPLFKVWGSGPDDVVAVGEEGTILRWNGTRWLAADSGINQRLVAVWGRGPDDVFAVGGAITGLLLHWDGAAWTQLFEAPEPLAGVTVVEGGGLLVAGSRGYVAAFGTAADDNFFQGGQSIAPEVDFHAAASGGGYKLVVGADLLSGGRPTWRGTLGSLERAVPETIARGPDATPVDAGPDGAGGDSMLPGPGERCADPPAFPNCRPGLECWVVQSTGEPICTQPCGDVGACGAYGSGACCERPGFQTLTTVCLTEASTGCGSVGP